MSFDDSVAEREPLSRFQKNVIFFGHGVRDFIPKVSFRDIKGTDLTPHLKLIPYDILVLLFISQVMLPVWAALMLVFVNIGTWWCYHRIPQFLRTVSGSQGESILISGKIVEYFARFISSCGVHHRAHYGLMFAMMAGFHTMMTGQLWGQSVSPAFANTVAWSSFTALFIVDFMMYWISLRTLQKLRQDKLEEANEYTEELKRSNEELEQFAYIASHDLRSPLRGIITLSEWIERDIKDTCSDETKKNLKLLNSRTQRMYNLLNDLLQYSRIGRVETEEEVFRPAELAEEIFESLSLDEGFQLHVTGKPILIRDYRIPYEMIMSNLIANAVKHHDQQTGNIWLDVKQTGQDILLTVEDDGPGIPVEHREKVFDVFTTLDRRDEKEATGMGLAIVKKITSHKGGALKVDDSPHGGARFTIRLPLQQRR